MCGVVAYYAEQPSTLHRDKFAALMEESKIRGLHSAGYYSTDERFKSSSISEVVKNIKAISTVANYMIGHTRYSTSGDWMIPENNQPLIGDGVALAFNGVISQASKEHWQDIYPSKYITENDGEIVLNMLRDNAQWEKFIIEGKFSFAGVLVDAKGNVWAIRNKTRPLWMSLEKGSVFVASTQDIFRRAGFDGELIEVSPTHPLKLNGLI